MRGTIGKLFRFVIVLSCIVALIFQLILTRSCTFVYKSAQDSDTAAITVDASTKTIDFGLYRIGINEVCLEGSTNYSALGGHDNDTLLFNARNCHITSMITGAIAMLLVVTEYLKCKIRWGKLIESIFFFIAWTNGLCVFILFGMDGCGNYLDGNQLQGQLDNMTSVVELIDRMDQNPNTNFTMSDTMREKVDTIADRDAVNATELIPSFLESIPFGTKCEWGQGASLNLMASLLYLGCGFLLCFAPNSEPIYGNDKEEDTQISGGTTELSLRETTNISAWSTTSGTDTDAKIV